MVNNSLVKDLQDMLKSFDIDMYIDKNNKIISAFPKNTK